MKEQISQYVQSLGGSTRYSGNQRTMYVMGITKEQAIEMVGKFPRLPFSIVRQA